MATIVVDELRRRLQEPTSRGLAGAVSAAIGDGALVEGQLLPPIRVLAAELALSPSTVAAAWAVLVRAGAIRTDGRRGSRVATLRPGPSRYRRALERPTTPRLDLSTGTPDPALLPDLGPSLARLGRRATAGRYLDDPTLPELAQALAATWPTPAPSLTVVDGAMDGLDALARQTLRPGDLVIVENPAFPPLLDLLDALGVRIQGVRLDDEGVVADDLAVALERRPAALFLQPRAHNPTGVTLSPRRVEELAALIEGTSTLVVEDDSVGDVAESPPVSLARFLPGQTVHVRSFSKSHGPDLRLAVMSGPPSVMTGLTERRHLGQGWTSRLLQSLLADLLTQASARAQVEAARREYARRRAAVIARLALRGMPLPAGEGLNLWLPVADETAALVSLAAHGIAAAAGRPFAAGGANGPHLRVTVGLVDDDSDAVADLLAEAAAAPPVRGPR